MSWTSGHEKYMEEGPIERTQKRIKTLQNECKIAEHELSSMVTLAQRMIRYERRLQSTGLGFLL